MSDATVGRWKLMHFTVSEAQYRVMVAQAIAEGGPNREERVKRTVPPGDYITLLRKATPFELRDIEEGRLVDADGPHPGYVPIMSDTPAEVNEHMHAWDHADGNVLITGLGLGVLVSGLLTRESVDHITVVEIDRDVIALTGHFYADHPKVTIVNMDALAYARHLDEEGQGCIFDYAWHDIWSHISDRNLENDELAEHGISYATMFGAYEGHCAHQGAWAYPEALEMRERGRFLMERADDWARRFVAASHAERIPLLVDFHTRRMLNIDPHQEIPAEVQAFANEHLKIEENVRLQLADDGGDELAADMQRILDTEESPEDPLDRPNTVPEANVA
jgi:hypothetical protein